MPIEVRELVIRARVEDQPHKASPQGKDSTAGHSVNSKDLQKVVTLCVEEVMKILKRKNER